MLLLHASTRTACPGCSQAELDAEVVEYSPPLTGLPLARFYYAHALFNKQRLPEAKAQLSAYFVDVEAAGPQKILNMPDGMLGRAVSDAERAASRFKVQLRLNGRAPPRARQGVAHLCMVAPTTTALTPLLKRL